MTDRRHEWPYIASLAGQLVFYAHGTRPWWVVRVPYADCRHANAVAWAHAIAEHFSLWHATCGLNRRALRLTRKLQRALYQWRLVHERPGANGHDRKLGVR
jgi:hypothetical protein